MTFPIISQASPDYPPICRTYPNLFILATQAPDEELRYWPDPTITSDAQFDLLYQHNEFPEHTMYFTEMRMCLLFAYYFTTW